MAAMSQAGSDDMPDTSAHPQQPAEGDRGEVDRALARDAAEASGDDPAGDSAEDADDT
jgi:hypothetical protein